MSRTLALSIGLATSISCRTPSSTSSEPKPAEPTPAVVAPAPAGVAAPEPPPEPVDPLLHLLGKGVPKAVKVLAIHERGRERIVLYRLDVAAQWEAGQPDADALLEPLQQVTEDCTHYYDHPDISCVEKSADAYPNVPTEVATSFVSNSRAFELAHVEFDSETEGSVLARVRLYEHGFTCDECFETTLEVSDMDGDSRAEILVVFPLEVPSKYNYGDKTLAVLAFVLDESDLHVQFATTRKHFDAGGDLTFYVDDFETSINARDTDADGHADLVVREVGTQRWSEEGDSEIKRIDESVTCLWERAGDRWVCPKALGKQVIDGTKLVEVTRIPLPQPEKAP